MPKCKDTLFTAFCAIFVASYFLSTAGHTVSAPAATGYYGPFRTLNGERLPFNSLRDLTVVGRSAVLNGILQGPPFTPYANGAETVCPAPATRNICNMFRLDLRQASQLIISQQSFQPESQYGIAYYYSGFGLFYQFLVYQGLFKSGNV